MNKNSVLFLSALNNNDKLEVKFTSEGCELENSVVSLQQQGKNGLWYGTDMVDGRYKTAVWRILISSNQTLKAFHQGAEQNNQLEHQDRIERLERLLEDVRLARNTVSKLRAINIGLLLVVMVLLGEIYL